LCTFGLVNHKLSPEKVTQAVRDFWNTFSGSSPEALADFYAPDATIFGVEGTRIELSRLAMARRAREYFDRRAKITARPDAVDVKVIAESVAIATYCFHFNAVNVGAAPGKTVQRTIPHGRATQIFHLDREGKIVIIHEHLSSADIRKE
jgi:ketosteroid isomerase-like protein